MRVVVVCVGRVRGAPFGDDVAHYERLLRPRARLEIHEVREAGADPGRAEQALESEAAALRKRVPNDAFVCALDRGGSQLSSTGLARFLEGRRQSGRDLCFVVGGPLGLAPSVIEEADATLSFGSVTLPHQLARVVLLEQLFRAHKILAGEPYHY